MHNPPENWSRDLNFSASISFHSRTIILSFCSFRLIQAVAGSFGSDVAATKVEPQVAVVCDLRNPLHPQYMDSTGKWISDLDSKNSCLRDKVEVLDFCRKVYIHLASDTLHNTMFQMGSFLRWRDRYSNQSPPLSFSPLPPSSPLAPLLPDYYVVSSNELTFKRTWLIISGFSSAITLNSESSTKETFNES